VPQVALYHTLGNLPKRGFAHQFFFAQGGIAFLLYAALLLLLLPLLPGESPRVAIPGMF